MTRADLRRQSRREQFSHYHGPEVDVKLAQCEAVHPELGLPCTLDRNHWGAEGHACVVPVPRPPGQANRPNEIARWSE